MTVRELMQQLQNHPSDTCIEVCTTPSISTYAYHIAKLAKRGDALVIVVDDGETTTEEEEILEDI